MLSQAVTIQYFVALIVGVLTAAYLHEGSHWFVGRLGKTEPSVGRDWLIVPTSVDHGNIETMDPEIIRLSGIAIFVWLPAALFAVIYFLSNPEPASFGLAIAFSGVIFMTSNSDIIAIRDPEKFRRMWINDEFQGTSYFFPYL